MKDRAIELIEELREDFDLLIDKIKVDEIYDFEIEDLVKLLETVKKEIYFLL